MARKRKGRSQKLAKAKTAQEPEDIARAPHTFVIKRGLVGRTINHLMTDVRKVMEPFTASNLKIGKNNVLKDYISIAGPLHVSHMIAFSKSDLGPSLRIMRLPRGPTLTFRIHSMSLMRDVVSALKKPHNHPKQYEHPPLLVLNNFSEDVMENKLTTTMLQSMFPSLNVTKLKLNTVKRCVLFNFDAETGMVEFRHYNIRAQPHGMSRVVKKIIKGKIPDMGDHQDISDFLANANNNAASESEAEDNDPDNKIELPQPISSRGNMAQQLSALRLTELGPRMSLELVKIEEEVCSGEVLYHKYIQKTEEEIRNARKDRILRMTKKADLKNQQERNVERKKRSLDEHKERCEVGHNKKTRKEKPDGEKPDDLSDGEDNYVEKEYPSDDDDEAWYEEEVGEKPEPGIMSSMRRGGFRGRGSRGGFRGGRGRGGGRFGDRGDSSMRGGFGDRGGRGGDRGRRGGDRGRGGGRFGGGGREDRGDRMRGSSRGRGGGRGSSRGGRDKGRTDSRPVGGRSGFKPVMKATAFRRKSGH